MPTSHAPEPDAPTRLLLIAGSRRRLHDLLEAFATLGDAYHITARLDRAIDLPGWVAETRPDAVIMDTDSPSRDTLEQIVVMSEHSPRPIVMFSQDGSAETMRQAVSAGVACYVVNSLQRERVLPLLQLARVRFEAWQAMRADMLRARQELQDHKLVEQAKRHLMNTRQMAEEAAYQALRREAMQRRVRIAEVARALLASV